MRRADRVAGHSRVSRTPASVAMKSIQLRRTGGPEALELVELPTPTPGTREVLIRAHAIGVSMSEVLVRRGTYKSMPPLPTIPGIEMSGVVVRLGSGATKLRVGQSVYVSAREFTFRGGCYAEYVAADEEKVFALPPDVDLDQAAALANYQVAWHLLHTATCGAEYRSVLVVAAAGGVGSALVQLARLGGKRVVGVVGSPRKMPFVRGQGADVVIDRSAGRLAESVRAATGNGVDLVLDSAGGGSLRDKFDCLAPFGMLVLYGSLAGPPAPDVLEGLQQPPQRSLAFRTFSMHTLDQMPERRAAATEELIRLLAAGAIRPAIHARLPLTDVRHAHELLESGEVQGKLIMKP